MRFVSMLTIAAALSSALLGYGRASATVVPDVPVGRQALPPRVAPTPVAPPAAGSDIYARNVNAVVLIDCRFPKGEGFGAGSIIGRSGNMATILTSAHVVLGADRCVGYLKPPGNGEITTKSPSYRLAVRALNKGKDLALADMQVPPGSSSVIELGRMDEVKVGQEVHAIGHPKEQFWTYTKGVVSQIRAGYDQAPANDEVPIVADVIQTQTPISPGNSGGPLLSAAGHLIGVNAFVKTGRDSQNLNFAVAVNEVSQFLKEASAGRHPVVASRREASDPKSEAPEDPKCPAKTLKEVPDERGGTDTHLDIKCAGFDNVVVFAPTDPSKEKIMYVATSKPEPGGKPRYNLRYYLDPQSGKVRRSVIDLDGDGHPDLMCIHQDGNTEPESCDPINATFND